MGILQNLYLSVHYKQRILGQWGEGEMTCTKQFQYHKKVGWNLDMGFEHIVLIFCRILNITDLNNHSVFLQKTRGRKGLRDNKHSLLLWVYKCSQPQKTFGLWSFAEKFKHHHRKKRQDIKIKGAQEHLTACNMMNHELSCLTWLFSWMLLRVLKSLNRDENWRFVLQLYF